MVESYKANIETNNSIDFEIEKRKIQELSKELKSLPPEEWKKEL